MIKFLKFVTDEDVLAEIVEETNTHYVLKNAAKFVFTPEGVELVPVAMFIKEDTITVAKDKVVFEGEPEEEATNAYNSRFGGLVVPPSNIQLA
jgi:hypothetical protein